MRFQDFVTDFKIFGEDFAYSISNAYGDFSFQDIIRFNSGCHLRFLIKVKACSVCMQ